MNAQKELWEHLAAEDPQYYVIGRHVTEQQAWEIGWKDYSAFILDDDLFPKSNALSILDVGCGIGRLTQFMVADYDQVIGVDISSGMLRAALRRLRVFSNVVLLESEGTDIKMVDVSVDLAFSYDVYQHCKTVEMVHDSLAEVHRILRPGGIYKAALRSMKEVHHNKNTWWDGVQFDQASGEALAQSVGFGVLKSSYDISSRVFWLWLQRQHD